MKKSNKKYTILDFIILDLLAHINPKFFILEEKNINQTQNTDKKNLNKYNKLFTGISHAYKKVLRYEFFFNEFYPNTKKISNQEALEHHIHAYLEDLDIFRNKIINFIGNLKNDFKKIAINKKEIDSVFRSLIENIKKIFENVSENRNPHHHHDLKFIDGDLIDSETAFTMVKQREIVREYIKPELWKIIEQRSVESFEKAKKKWIIRARNNSSQITIFINEFFDNMKPHIYNLLSIKQIFNPINDKRI